MTSPADRIISLYRRHAGTWHSRRATQPGRLMEQPWLDRFCALLPAHPHVLDIGCGSGEPIARALVEHGCSVTGIDAAPEMIALCAAHFPTDTWPGLSWQVADMRRLALGRSFDGLIAWDSFFHLPADDQRGMFPIFRAHAADNAALMFTSGPASGEAIGVFEGERLYHASLDASEYQTLLAENGFTVAAHIAEDPACGGHTVWLAQRR